MTLSLLSGLFGGGHSQANTSSNANSGANGLGGTNVIFVPYGGNYSASFGNCGGNHSGMQGGMGNGYLPYGGGAGNAATNASLTNIINNLLGGVSGSTGNAASSGSMGGVWNGVTGGSNVGIPGLVNNLLGNTPTQGTNANAGQGHGIVGNVLGSALQNVHGAAETLISMTGLGGLFAPIDDAIIHPILWDPLSMVTGYDVSAHPNGVADVSNPLNVNRG